MNILAVDTALSACSVAILLGDRAVVRCEPMPRGHAEALMPMLADALAEAGIGYGAIDRFAVTVGPGTFTGVRVGVAAVRGLALATGRPAVGVTTLEALAATARRREAVAMLVAMDARRDEIYAQTFSAEGEPTSRPQIRRLDDLIDGLADAGTAAGMAVVGSAAEMVADAARAAGREARVLGTDSAPDPLEIARIASERAPEGPVRPLYLRAPDAKPQAHAAIDRR
ncbi:tRNA (adenosine(37)-N6)-threonylcarbamoyltransferase complex dimerization subunit type 1 TsaB [Microbaculum marinisediminis]|uniref:tRNA (Adenosine(37)-N6)-threonylcarbamoyltransferase complex dimerization subunit type 1 TsaB n=1 Tax=Microbaculum marinisediminis TaxID=2931392 RepID=A0AAW5QYC8_9HYPH|nr:tRNA (adenosine(37)-N6)-threonylcarbamoyltransferase complex dimerization subunit type 1 TsaB [Microbaculum sp. A6E488]MCT8972142.1 tRNA (adenosine(37)-N6)-threonylcarbamoyltransferase complex dimerization subunit type 1 TsaB [Microbaculum sp. A6E488]